MAASLDDVKDAILEVGNKLNELSYLRKRNEYLERRVRHLEARYESEYVAMMVPEKIKRRGNTNGTHKKRIGG